MANHTCEIDTHRLALDTICRFIDKSFEQHGFSHGLRQATRHGVKNLIFVELSDRRAKRAMAQAGVDVRLLQTPPAQPTKGRR